MKIKKVAQTPGVLATVSTSKIDSDKDTYSCNYLNDNAVVVSPTEPSDGKAWIQKGKNLFDGKLEYGTISTSNGELGDATTAIRSVNYIKVNQESDYTISNNKNYENLVFYYDEAFNCLGHDRGGSNGVLSFKTKSNTSYIKFRTSTASEQNDLTTLFQLEQGYVATEYEPYTRKIHTNTGNGYEEFYNEEDHKGVILFDGAAIENINLNDNTNNYRYIEVFYQSDDFYSSVKVPSNAPSISCILVTFDLTYPNTPGFILHFKSLINNGTILNVHGAGRFYKYTNESNITQDTKNQMYVSKVVGYK